MMKTMDQMKSIFKKEMESMKIQIMTYQQVLFKIKNYLNLTGEMDF